jgi:hypothetical protein
VLSDRVLASARGEWPQVLGRIGVRTELLTPRHGPCPGCGGRDRFRFDDKEGFMYLDTCHPGKTPAEIKEMCQFDLDISRVAGETVVEVVRSGLLDDRICEVCERKDGDTFAYGSPEHQANLCPDSECLGTSLRCRCMLIDVFADEGEGALY